MDRFFSIESCWATAKSSVCMGSMICLPDSFNDMVSLATILSWHPVFPRTSTTDCGHKFSALDFQCSGSLKPPGLLNSSAATSYIDKLFSSRTNNIAPFGVDPVFLSWVIYMQAAHNLAKLTLLLAKLTLLLFISLRYLEDWVYLYDI
jgi:hypothetical protein